MIAAIDANCSEVIAIYLFGSTGTAYETSESDVDIALLTNQKITPDKRLDLINALIDATHNDKIDFIDLKNAPTILKFQIIMNSKRIYCQNTVQADAFEMYTFSDYVRLNEERYEIMQAIKKRGSVF